MAGGISFPFGRPVYVMAKPAGAECNLACDYCYYLEKKRMYAHAGRMQMSDATLEEYVRQYFESQTQEAVSFTWHGGEPMLRPLAFYERVVALQRRYARGRYVENSIQTNGTLLTPEWCRFLRREGWLVGISIDGTAAMHDACRHRRDGRGVFDAVMRGVEMLKQHGVEWNAMATVNAANAGQPEVFYDFFKALGARFLQFTPVVERLTRHTDGRRLALGADGTGSEAVAPYSVSPEAWGEFLCRVFDRWIQTDVGEVFVQMFDATLANRMGVQPGVCTLAPTCGHAGVMEWNGDVYCCDHFVAPEYRLGNIRTQTLTEMMYGEKQRAFGAAKRNSLPGQCRRCKWLYACNGECPRNRFMKTADGEPGLNYLCAGYARFFEHVAPYMDAMAAALRTGLEAREWRRFMQ